MDKISEYSEKIRLSLSEHLFVHFWSVFFDKKCFRNPCYIIIFARFQDIEMINCYITVFASVAIENMFFNFRFIALFWSNMLIHPCD